MNKRSIGSLYEDKACKYLESSGYIILERNFRNRTGEIDIIAKIDKKIVFVEVKYRQSNDKGYPEDAVTRKKMQKIINVAKYYLLTHGLFDDVNVRFDVICFYTNDMKHYRNAFSL